MSIQHSDEQGHHFRSMDQSSRKDGSMSNIPKIAAAYIRVSTDDQAEYSPDAQLVEIRKYAVSNGYILPEEYVFVDEGISGKHTEKREAFNRMIGVAKTKPKPFDAILLWKFSRFARNREDSIVYKSMLRRQLGIDVISISEPVGDDKMSIIIEAMIEAMDEYYSINLAEEVRRGMSEKARRGGLQCTPSFGYTVKDNTLIPVESEASLVKEMFQRYLDGQGFFPIATWLNDMGVKTHRGNNFENRTVEYILRNPVYIGKLRWNPTGRSRRDFDNEHIILADAGHEPLIDMETWNAVQKAIKRQKELIPYHGRPSYDRKDWMSGIIRCAACGGTLIFSKPNYFKCNNYVRGRCKHSQHIRVDLLHDAVLEQLRADACTPDNLRFTVVRQSSDGADRLTKLKKQLEQLERKKARLREAYLAGAESVQEYADAKAALDQEGNALSAQIAELKDVGTGINMADRLRENILACLAVLEADDVGIDQKYNAANSIIECCTLDKSAGMLEIIYRVLL